jgi:D-alanine-D-alanine ligase
LGAKEDQMKVQEEDVGELDKPPSTKSTTGRQAAPWRVALLANLRSDVHFGADAPADAGAEYDRQDTVEAIAQALEADGHWVTFLPADHTLPDSLHRLRPHICFNISEGLAGDAREAQVPALCELLAIPYTGSRVMANSLSLEKTLTKRIWRDHGLPTARFQEFTSSEDPLDPGLRFPLFVKPAREGTGMGIDLAARARDEAELRSRVGWVLSTYRQPALVEEFLPGREFTVGFIGNPGVPLRRRRPWLYDSNGYHFFPVLEIEASKSVTPGVYSHDAKALEPSEVGAPQYLCPAEIPDGLRTRLYDLTRRAAEAVGAADVSRVDFRIGADGEPYLLEINTLPGLNPIVSDLCIISAAEGISYQILITEILYLAAERFGLRFQPGTLTRPRTRSRAKALVPAAASISQAPAN